MVKQKYVQTRPKCPIKGKANVRLWWLFAYNAVLEDFRAEKKEMRRRLWIAMKRVRYSNLYKATLCANELVTKDKITVDGWNELIALDLDNDVSKAVLNAIPIIPRGNWAILSAK